MQLFAAAANDCKSDFAAICTYLQVFANSCKSAFAAANPYLQLFATICKYLQLFATAADNCKSAFAPICTYLQLLALQKNKCAFAAVCNSRAQLPLICLFLYFFLFPFLLFLFLSFQEFQICRRVHASQNQLSLLQRHQDTPNTSRNPLTICSIMFLGSLKILESICSENGKD